MEISYTLGLVTVPYTETAVLTTAVLIYDGRKYGTYGRSQDMDRPISIWRPGLDGTRSIKYSRSKLSDILDMLICDN